MLPFFSAPGYNEHIFSPRKELAMSYKHVIVLGIDGAGQYSGMRIRPALMPFSPRAP